MNPSDIYLQLMETIRHRLDVIATLREGTGHDFVRAESAAFHGRKVVEAIAFACLVAVDNSFKVVPRDAKGQWNAETILRKLQSKSLEVLPSPSIIRPASAEERRLHNVNVIIEGLPDRRVTCDELIAIYQRLHPWLHEANPYTSNSHEAFCTSRASVLWADLLKLQLFVDKHVMAIRDAGFFCVLKDDMDCKTKVVPIYREMPIRGD